MADGLCSSEWVWWADVEVAETMAAGCICGGCYVAKGWWWCVLDTNTYVDYTHGLQNTGVHIDRSIGCHAAIGAV